MLAAILHHWNNLFAPRDWDVYGDVKSGTWRARRWRNGTWETRDATEDESADAAAWQSHA